MTSASCRAPRCRALALALALAAALLAAGMPALRAQTAPPAEPEAQPALPRYLLQDPAGRAVTSEDFRGRFQLVAFGFVSCPDVCPTTMLEMQQVLARLGARARQVQPIFITVDPQRDTPEVLRAYTAAFDERIVGLTGSEALVRRAADAFNVRYARQQEPGAPADVYTMDHTAGMFLLDPGGRLVARLGYGTPVPELVARIRQWLDAAGR
jgi:protein SCO1/2